LTTAEDPFLHLSRVAGLTAYVLLWLNVCLGLGLKTSVSLPFLKRWRAVDLHQFTALLALAFLGLHIAVLVQLKQQPFSLPEVWIPVLRSVEATLGITALYLIILVIATSYLRRHLNLLAWRTVHALSMVSYVLAVAHALMAGPDGDASWARLLYWSTNSVLVALFARRVWLTRRVQLRRRLSVPPNPLYPSEIGSASIQPGLNRG
jgi:DMSO/TMAO reductase YedYZ heme-binding membrane subunit